MTCYFSHRLCLSGLKCIERLETWFYLVIAHQADIIKQYAARRFLARGIIDESVNATNSKGRIGFEIKSARTRRAEGLGHTLHAVVLKAIVYTHHHLGRRAYFLIERNEAQVGVNSIASEARNVVSALKSNCTLLVSSEAVSQSIFRSCHTSTVSPDIDTST